MSTQAFDIRTKIENMVVLLEKRAADWSSHSQLMEGEGLAGISDNSLPGYITANMARGMADLRSSDDAMRFAGNSASKAAALRNILSLPEISVSDFSSKERRDALLTGASLVLTEDVDTLRAWLEKTGS